MSQVNAPERPLLLLDVDRAISPISKPDVPGEIWGCSRIFGFEMPFHPELRSWLRRLAEEYEMVWASTWEADGLDELALHLNLPSGMRRIPFGSESDLQPPEIDEFAEEPHTQKLFYVEHWLRENGHDDRQLAWVDDDLEADAFDWAEVRSAPTLLVRTDRDYGIAVADVERLEMFALSPQLLKEPA